MKRRRSEIDAPDLLGALHDDLLVLVLVKLGSSASRPADLLSILPTCRRLNALARDPAVLAAASPGALAVPPRAWCDSAHDLLRRCSSLGNPHASYMLGMIMFYCLLERKEGIAEMARAGMKGHAAAIFSLAVIHFNGSGWKGRCAGAIRVGALLCARAAALGHVPALRELGHCLEDGYGAQRDPARGRRCLAQASAREGKADRPADDPARRFLAGWFEGKDDVVMCGERSCGRREMRRMEFRRCSGCGEVGYCCKSCQASDWRVGHRVVCSGRRRLIAMVPPIPVIPGTADVPAAAVAAPGGGQ